jgi:hypothetical protein
MEKEETHSIEIDGEKFEVKSEVYNAFRLILDEITLGQEFEGKIITAKMKFGNDADLGKFVRNLINEQDSEH